MPDHDVHPLLEQLPSLRHLKVRRSLEVVDVAWPIAVSRMGLIDALPDDSQIKIHRVNCSAPGPIDEAGNDNKGRDHRPKQSTAIGESGHKPNLNQTAVAAISSSRGGRIGAS